MCERRDQLLCYDEAVLDFYQGHALKRTREIIRQLGKEFCIRIGRAVALYHLDQFWSNYLAQVDQETCVACGACAERCHMDAITVDETARVNPARCIGCGVCVPVCPTSAMRYLHKDPADRYVPPANIAETYLKMGQERGLA